MIEILAGLETYLYVISSSLFYPVIAALVFLTIWTLYALGAFLRELIERKRGVSFAVKLFRDQISNQISLMEGPHRDMDILLERLLQDNEIRLQRSLDRTRFMVRVGPALGLMGTLIPMGVSLASLAKGDMPKMASSMVTAFTTTVVGLACGVVAFLITLVKERWVKMDLKEMEFLAELTLRNLNDATKRGEGQDEVCKKTMGDTE